MMFRLFISSFILALLGCVICARSQAPLRNRQAPVRPPVQVTASAQQDETSLRFIIKNNSNALQGTLTVNDSPRTFKATLSLPAGASSPLITVPADYLVTGGNRVHFQWAAARLDTTLFNWNIPARGIAFEKIDLSSRFKSKLSQLFSSIGITDEGLRKAAAESNEILLPQGIPFTVITDTFRNNVLMISYGDSSHPPATIDLAGQASHLYIMLTGTAVPQSGAMNGEIFISYADSTADTLQLISKRNWSAVDSIENAPTAVPMLRMYLKTGETVWPSAITTTSKHVNTQSVDGGAAIILDLPLDVSKELKSLSIRAAAPTTTIGLMALTLARN